MQFGTSWSALTNAGSKAWHRVRCSSDCSTIVGITANSDHIYVSRDSGVNWSTLSSLGYRNWRHITVSGDGSKIFAADLDGNTISGDLTLTTAGAPYAATSLRGLIKLIYAGSDKFTVSEYKDVQFY